MAWLQKVQEPLLFLIGAKGPLLDIIKRRVESMFCSPIGQQAGFLGVQRRRLYLTHSSLLALWRFLSQVGETLPDEHILTEPFLYLSDFAFQQTCDNCDVSLNWLFNPKNLFWGLKLFLCLSLRGSRWFPHYGWQGHSAVSCCFQVSSEYWLYILKTCAMTCFGKHDFFCSFLQVCWRPNLC